MNKFRIGLILVFTLCFNLISKAQSPTSLRINEVLVDNQTNLVDSYGERVAWIEIYNKSYGTVKMEGCYITNEKNNPTKFRIPKGNVNTIIPPRQYLLFWADNNPNRGAFYLNFALDPNKDNYLAIYDTDGKTLIDEVTIPASAIMPDLSYGRVTDGSNKWEVKGNTANTSITPGANNLQNIENLKVIEFQEQDSVGIGMAIIAMTVVFSALVLLFFSFKFVGIISIKMSNKRAMKENKKNNDVAVESTTPVASVAVGSEDEIAAIVMALHEHFGGYHDIEEMVLTFKEVGTSSSPWSSKAFGLRQFNK